MYTCICMYHSVSLCTAEETKEEKRHLAESELPAWKIKPVSALYRVAAARCQGSSQNGSETFLLNKKATSLQLSRRERV